jgi:membrane protein
MMASLRAAMRLVWDAPRGRRYVGGKLLDFALVLGTGLLLLAASVLAVVTQVVVAIGDDLAEAIGWHGEGQVLSAVSEIGSSLTLTFVAILLLYRILCPVPVRVADLWPAALLAAVAIQIAVAGFGFYLAHFSSFSAIYGSLGAMLGFLLLVYVIAALLLFGAEVAAAWPEGKTKVGRV